MMLTDKDYSQNVWGNRSPRDSTYQPISWPSQDQPTLSSEDQKEVDEDVEEAAIVTKRENAAAELKAFKPQEYSTVSIYSGKTKFADFKGDDKEFATYKSRIRDGMKTGPNFAGHYSVVQFGCGTECTLDVIGDNKTGRPFWFMRGGDDNLALQLRYSRESSLLAAQWASSELDKCFVELFDFQNDEWKPLKKSEIGNRQACYTDISTNVGW